MAKKIVLEELTTDACNAIEALYKASPTECAAMLMETFRGLGHTVVSLNGDFMIISIPKRTI